MKNYATIRRISATGVLGEFSYDVSFDEAEDTNRMRVVYAPNGRGKTNFLRAVSLLLTPSVDSLQSLIDIPIENLSISFANSDQIQLNRTSASEDAYTLQASLNKADRHAELAVDPSEFTGALYKRFWSQRDDYVAFLALTKEIKPGVTLIGDDRLRISPEETRDRRPMNSPSPRTTSGGIVSELVERVERMFSRSAFAGLSRDKAATGVYAQITRTTLVGTRSLSTAEARADLESKIRYLRQVAEPYEQYGLMSIRQLRDIDRQLSLARQNSRELPTLHRILSPYLDSIQDQVEALAPSLEVIDTFVTGINSFLDRKELTYSTARGVNLIGRDNVSISPDSLSSGERHLLLLMSHAVLSTVEKPLVIIDEPELSLGIDWQRNLLPELLRCTQSSQVQFLVASHSLQVMNGVEHDDIIQPTEN